MEPGLHNVPTFTRYIGVDYSGAETPTSSLRGLRVYSATPNSAPVEVSPPPSPRRYWTRRGLAEWLATELVKDERALVGIDHGFSFPLAYFTKYGLAHDWPAFLDDFQRHWPTDHDVYVDFVRTGLLGNAAARVGDPNWFRLTELRTGTASSVFNFNARQRNVAKSTHSGIPWLRYIRNNTQGKVHFWPFDGWDPPAGKSVVVEVYPRLWSKNYPRADRTPDQHDAYSVAATLCQADQDGTLAKWLSPKLTPEEKETASIEGWILGVS
ncbi:MAG: hypothetical protein IT462_11465 [Planctomycetes bacterium]|nr:hypothetical protein [Planctomycetota bacterium]